MKALGASLLTLGLVLAGAAVPAQAAALDVTISTAGQTIGTSGTNAAPITVGFTTVTSGATAFQIQSPDGWSAVDINTICVDITINSPNTDPRTCNAYVGGTALVVSIQKSSGSWAAGVPFSVQFPQQSLNTGTNRTWIATTRANNANVDQGFVTLPGGVTNYTVTFNANGGSGSMSNQTASTATNLTANAFTRSGYTFAGWATTTTGPVAYSNSASYAFTSSTTLYAVWTPVLATTGFDGVPYAATGAALLFLGAGVYLYSRRSRA